MLTDKKDQIKYDELLPLIWTFPVPLEPLLEGYSENCAAGD
jgi:hypothetical protein